MMGDQRSDAPGASNRSGSEGHRDRPGGQPPPPSRADAERKSGTPAQRVADSAREFLERESEPDAPLKKEHGPPKD